MRDRFLVPGLAVVGFAATLALTGWPHLEPVRWHQPAPLPQVAPPAVKGQATRPVPTPVAEPASVSPQPEAPPPGTDADSEAAAPQPTLPDSAALPSFEEDQAARNADALRNARSR